MVESLTKVRGQEVIGLLGSILFPQSLTVLSRLLEGRLFPHSSGASDLHRGSRAARP